MSVILIQISCDFLYIYTWTVFHFVGKIAMVANVCYVKT